MLDLLYQKYVPLITPAVDGRVSSEIFKTITGEENVNFTWVITMVKL